MSILPCLKREGRSRPLSSPPVLGLEEASLLPSRKWEGRRASVFARVQSYLHIQQQIRQKKVRVQKQDQNS